MAQSLEKTYRNLLRRCLAERQNNELESALAAMEAGDPEEHVFQDELLNPRLHSMVAELRATASRLNSLDANDFQKYRSWLLTIVRDCPEWLLDYAQEIGQQCPTITSIWLFGSRANNNAKEDSDWDVAVFGPREVAAKLEANSGLRKEVIDLLLVDSGSHEFRKLWREDSPDWKSFRGWHWREKSDNEAEYKATKFRGSMVLLEGKLVEAGPLDVLQQRALRLWPDGGGV